jgi:hypothetical protein
MLDAIPWSTIQEIVTRDPGGRGVSGFRYRGRPLGDGNLQRAALSLAEGARGVAIVTGFAVEADGGVVPETDGPPGALYLARALAGLGADVTLISDRYAAEVLQTGLQIWEIPAVPICEAPCEESAADLEETVCRGPSDDFQIDRWNEEFLRSPRGQRLTHLVAVERAGPSHTETSLREQLAAAAQDELSGPIDQIVARFAAHVPPEHRDVCHNMRGAAIDAFTARLHRLFEMVNRRRPQVVTLAAADGGNEIGMGSFSWDMLTRAIAQGPAERIICRVPCHYAIVGGVSNWVAYALGNALCVLRGARELAAAWSAADEGRRIEALVRDSRCVDGITRRRAPTIDSLPLASYLRVLSDLRQALGLPEKKC